MGRAKVIMSHCRNINMEMTQKFIRYRIPLYSETESLGKLISSEIKDNEIILKFENIKNEPSPATIQTKYVDLEVKFD